MLKDEYMPRFFERDERARAARILLNLFDRWQLSSDVRLAFLGLPAGNPRTISRYRRGAPLVPGRDLQDRVGHYLAIHRLLRQLFPTESDKAYGWMKRRNRAFEGRTPAEMIVDFGFPGLLMVRTYLERIG